MLFEMLAKVVERIEGFDLEKETPAFAGELKSARADLFGPLIEKLGRDQADRVAAVLAACQLVLIKEIPVIVDSIRQAVEPGSTAERSTHPAVRCAMVGALAYLVKPLDLIPDDRPGGFGFVDDCMILRATMSEYFDMLPAGFTTHDRERNNLRLLACCVAPDSLPRFQEAIDGVWRLFQSLLLVPPSEVEHVTEKLIRDPLTISLPVPEAGPGKLAAGPILSGCLEAGAVQLEGQRVCVLFPDGVKLLLGE